MIEKCGDIEYEIEKILEHSNKLYNYIQNNLFLERNMENIIHKISNIKKAKELLKKKFMINSVKCVKAGMLKKDLENKNNFIIKVKAIQDIIKLLLVLSGNQSKYELVNELIIKAREILQKFPTQIKCRIKICEKLEEELDRFNRKSCENMVEELQKNIIDVLSDSIEILPFLKVAFVNFKYSLQKLSTIYLCLQI